jgi:RHS repeat-associated protein
MCRNRESAIAHGRPASVVLLMLALLLAAAIVGLASSTAQAAGSGSTGRMGPASVPTSTRMASSSDGGLGSSGLLGTDFSTQMDFSTEASCDPNTQSCKPPDGGGGGGGGGSGDCPKWKQDLGLCKPGDGGGGTCGPGPGGPPDQCSPGPTNSPGGAGGSVNVGGGNPVNLITGNKYQTEVDLPALPGVLGLELSRHFNAMGRYSGLTGSGWRTSYEAVLYDFGSLIQITQADGRRITFNRVLDAGNAGHGTLCTASQPQDGQVTIHQRPNGKNEYRWRWTDGRVLSFSDGSGGGHPLQSIQAASGEMLSLTYAPKGELVRVRDPQGRSLDFVYDRQARLKAIVTPASRIEYTIDSIGRLTQVSINPRQDGPATQSPPNIRRYHYEDRYNAGWKNVLTGISAVSFNDKGLASEQRLSTYAYDTQGRAVLTTKGRPREVVNGQPKPDTGIEQVDLKYEDITAPAEIARLTADLKDARPRLLSKTTLTNATGQTTEIISAVIGGHYRLLSMKGPGCRTCGPSNRAYSYDAAGRLVKTTQLDAKGQPQRSSYERHDAHGRLIEQGVQEASDHAAQWQVRYRYRDIQFKDGSLALGQQPIVMARPSVVPGRQALSRLEYNDRGQLLKATDDAWSPVDAQGKFAADSVPIRRSTAYVYTLVGSHSVLAQIDGPLANGPKAEPGDSDITRYRWDAQGDRIVGITHPGGAEDRVADVNGAGLPTRIERTGQVPVQLNWNAQGALIGMTQGERSTSIQTDAQGLPVGLRDAAGRWMFVQRDVRGQVTEIRDAQGNRQQQIYDAEGRPLAQVIRSADAAVQYAQAWLRGEQGQVLARLSSERIEALQVSDAEGNWSASVQGDAPTMLPVAADAGQPHASANEVASRKPASPGDGERVQTLAWQDPAGAVTAMLHGRGALLVQDPLARIHATLWDDFGRRVFERNADRGVTRYAYDEQGLWSRRTDALGQTLTLRFDGVGRVVAKEVSDSVDAATRAVVAPGCTSTYRYNEQNQRTAVQGCGSTERFEYDAYGHMVLHERRIEPMQADAQAKQPAAAATSTATTITFTERYRYSTTTGELIEHTLPGGQTLTYRYDAQAARLSAIGLKRSGAVERWLHGDEQAVLRDVQYAAFGPRTRINYGNGVQSAVAYDKSFKAVGVATVLAPAAAQSQQRTARAAGGEFERAATLFGIGTALASEGSSSSPNLTILDSLGLVRDGRGRVGAQLDNGQLRLLGYDSAGNLAQVVHAAASSAKQSSSTSVQVGMNNSAPVSTRFAYNRLGERLDAQAAGWPGSTQSPAEAAADKHDALGRSTTHNGWHLVWDAEDRLISAHRPDGQRLNYRYDDAGQMIARVHVDTNGTRTVSNRHYDAQGRMVAETAPQRQGAHANPAPQSQAASISRQYIYLGLQPVAVLDSESEEHAADAELSPYQLRYVHTDHLGTPRLVTDEQAHVLWRGELDAWGRVRSVSAQALQPADDGLGRWVRNKVQALLDAAMPQAKAQEASTLAADTAEIRRFELNLRLPGMVEDTLLGLHYNVQRWYDPQAGRYLSADPLGLAEGLNQYAYVNNQPAEGSDPWGLFKIDTTEGQGIHADIVKEAFRVAMGEGNSSYLDAETKAAIQGITKGSFSDFFITLAARSNWWTDAMQSSQFNRRNHFDNPNATGTGYGSGNFPYWIQESLDSVNSKRNQYTNYFSAGGYQGLSADDKRFISKNWGPNKYYTEPGTCPIYTDLRKVVQNFGENTHTLADFYAHSNWADDTKKGGEWEQSYYVKNRGWKMLTGTVAYGLGQTQVWDEAVRQNLFSGNAEGCNSLSCALTAYGYYTGSIPGGYDRGPTEALRGQPIDTYIHNVFDGVDEYQHPDKRTHAYWAKDESSKANFQIARDLAVSHTTKEVAKLFNEAKNTSGLLDVFKMNESQMQQDNILYWIEYGLL